MEDTKLLKMNTGKMEDTKLLKILDSINKKLHNERSERCKIKKSVVELKKRIDFLSKKTNVILPGRMKIEYEERTCKNHLCEISFEVNKKVKKYYCTRKCQRKHNNYLSHFNKDEIYDPDIIVQPQITKMQELIPIPDQELDVSIYIENKNKIVKKTIEIKKVKQVSDKIRNREYFERHILPDRNIPSWQAKMARLISRILQEKRFVDLCKEKIESVGGQISYTNMCCFVDTKCNYVDIYEE